MGHSRDSEEDRKAKEINMVKYKTLNNYLRRKIDKGKQKYLETVYEEIMEYQRR